MGSEKRGEIIRKAREKAEMTQLEVAEKLKMNVNYYARIERGEINPSIKKLKAIGKLLKIKPSDLTAFLED